MARQPLRDGPAAKALRKKKLAITRAAADSSLSAVPAAPGGKFAPAFRAVYLITAEFEEVRLPHPGFLFEVGEFMLDR